MELAVLAGYGFLLSFLGVLPPGIININTAIVSVEKGVSKGIVFALGACFIVLFQTLISILIAMNINIDVSLISTIEKIAVFIFLALSAYFYLCASKKVKKKEIKRESNTRVFMAGMFFSVINFLPIPYHIGWSKALNLQGKFDFVTLNIATFIFCVLVGTFVANYLYIVFFKKFNTDPQKFAKYANYTLAFLCLLLALIELIKINFYN